MVPDIINNDNNTAKFDDQDDHDDQEKAPPKPSITNSMITHQETVGSTSFGSVGSYYDSDADSSSSGAGSNNDADMTEHSTAEQLIQDEYRALLTTLDPPMSRIELFRDRVLRTLDHPYMQAMGLFVIFMIVLDGALFFFMFTGWHRMCDTPTKRDCEPRNWWYNLSIQILNIFITYMQLVSFPWRATNFIHITGWTWCCGCGSPRRNNTVGCGLYGIPNDPDIWFHIPLRKRLGITCILLCNNILQFVNHSMRLTYRDYESQNTWPGNLLTSCFFLTSFTCAGIGGSWMLCEMSKIRKAAPGKFDPGPLEAMKQKFSEFSASMKQSKTGIKASNSFNFNLSEEEYEHQPPHKSSSSGYLEDEGITQSKDGIFNESFPDLPEGVPLDEDEETGVGSLSNITDTTQPIPSIRHSYSEDCYDVRNRRRGGQQRNSFPNGRSLGSGTFQFPSPPPSPTKRQLRPRSQTMGDLPADTDHSYFDDEFDQQQHQEAGQDPLAADTVQRNSMPNLPSHTTNTNTNTTTHRVHIFHTHRYPDPTRDPLHRAVIGDDRDRAAFRMFAC